VWVEGRLARAVSSYRTTTTEACTHAYRRDSSKRGLRAHARATRAMPSSVPRTAEATNGNVMVAYDLAESDSEGEFGALPVRDTRARDARPLGFRELIQRRAAVHSRVFVEAAPLRCRTRFGVFCRAGLSERRRCGSWIPGAQQQTQRGGGSFWPPNIHCFGHGEASTPADEWCSRHLQRGGRVTLTWISRWIWRKTRA
jgi:hypothetical protein